MAAVPLPGMRARLARLAPTAKAAPLVLAAGIVFYMVNLREAHFANVLQLAAGWTCLAVLFVMYLIPGARKPPWRFLFLLLSLYLAMRYMWWRTFDTLIYTNPWDFLGMSVLFLAEVYSLVVHFLQLFVNFWPIDRDPVPLPADRSTWPTVDIFIPTYTENEDIVRLTALAATQIDYPRNRMRIFILDDGATLARRNDPDKSEAAWRRRYRLKEIARETVHEGAPLARDPFFARRVAEVETDLLALEYTELRALAGLSAGKAPGPESSILKIKGTEIAQAIDELLVEAAGWYALPFVPGQFQAGYEGYRVGPGAAANAAPIYFNNRKASIYGGSNEIQRNIIAKEVLGL